MPRRRPPIRFGVFEADLEAGELRRKGVRVKLQEQPFQVLAALLEKPGEIVTKEELQERIWAAETFVDFDRSLATAVNKVRQALGDSATGSRFVETVPKKGYRFIGLAAASAAKTNRLAWTPSLVAIGLAALAAAIWVHGRTDEPPAQTEWSSPTPLTAYPGFESQPAISPDESRVAFRRILEYDVQSDIYVKQIGPGDPLGLTDSSANEGWPQWSPDGRHIAFARETSVSTGEVVRIPATGGQEVRLASFAVLAAHTRGYRPFCWTPDGEGLVISDRRDADPAPRLYFVSLETGVRKALTELRSEVDGHSDPSFSSSGALSYLQHNSDGSTDILIWNLQDASEPVGRPEAADSLEYRVSGASIDPTGHEIVLSAWAPEPALWRIALDSKGGHERLGPAWSSEPAFSAGGTMLAYSDRVYRRDIWRVELSGPGVAAGPPERWIASTHDDGVADYSPDGRQVVFQSMRGGSFQIWVADSEANHAIQLTSRDSSMTGSPKWSPDGSKIAFDSTVGGKFAIFVMNANGSGVRQVTDSATTAYAPFWSPDGNWIYFVQGESTQRALGRVRAEGGPAEEVKGDFFAVQIDETGRYIYGLDPGLPGAIVRLTIATGEIEPVFDQLVRDFYYTPQGIYIVKSESTSIPSRIWFYRFEDQSTSVVAEGLSFSLATRMRASPDGRYLTFGHTHDDGSDLMLIRRTAQEN